MRILLLVVLGVSAGLGAGAARAHELDLSFNSDAFRFVYARRIPDRALRTDFGWLHSSNSGDALHAGLQLVSPATSGSDPLLAGVGGRIVYFNGKSSDQDGLVLAVGGSLRYTVPGYNRFAVSGEVWYSPDVLSTMDAEEYRELMVRGSYNITRQAEAYVGARHVRGEFKRAPDYHFDTGMHLGLNLRF